MTYAQPEHVAARWGRTLTPEEITLVATRLADAERMILRRVPDLVSKIVDGTVFEDDVIQVEADAVLRLVRNPSGFLSESDGNYTYMFSQAAAAGRLEITPEEWRMLGVDTGGMFTLIPSYSAWATQPGFAQGG